MNLSSFYDSPTDEDPTQHERPEDETRRRLRRVANYQRLVLCGAAGQLFAIALVVLDYFDFFQLPDLVQTVGLVFLAASAVFNGAAVFLTRREFAAGVSMWVYTVLAVVPVFSLVILGITNIAATSFLQDNDIRVGVLGADPGQLP
jgi:hypothetical protein